MSKNRKNNTNALFIIIILLIIIVAGIYIYYSRLETKEDNRIILNQPKHIGVEMPIDSIFFGVDGEE